MKKGENRSGSGAAGSPNPAASHPSLAENPQLGTRPIPAPRSLQKGGQVLSDLAAIFDIAHRITWGALPHPFPPPHRGSPEQKWPESGRIDFSSFPCGAACRGSSPWREIVIQKTAWNIRFLFPELPAKSVSGLAEFERILSTFACSYLQSLKISCYIARCFVDFQVQVCTFCARWFVWIQIEQGLFSNIWASVIYNFKSNSIEPAFWKYF